MPGFVRCAACSPGYQRRRPGESYRHQGNTARFECRSPPTGASAWTAKRREAYANDLAAPTSLIAVTAKSNRSKADKDPGEWLPPTATYHCAYVTGWVETKLRWSLAADDREREALLGLAEDCPGATVAYETVPFTTTK
ncbi:DUF1524 domain-containing protein [Streptomyces sp. NPDC006450]|uniref:GmrSD restriction endonuclease domain-containing protein n=1 Tax=Streptomyces sp. NPDC006450 TaxID=3155458 RepID=UPI00339EB9D3